MGTICEGPQCDVRVTQPNTGRRRRFCSAACRKAAFHLRHNEIAWEPLDGAVAAYVPEPTPTPNPDEAVAGAIVEARTLAGTFRNLGRRGCPQLAWRCTKTGEAIRQRRCDFFHATISPRHIGSALAPIVVTLTARGGRRHAFPPCCFARAAPRVASAWHR